MEIRYTTPSDIPALQSVLDATELFPSAMLPEMLAIPDALWLTCLNNANPIGLCFVQPEELTDGTWNMRAIAVDPASQSRGYGKAMVAHLERLLHDQGARILIVDTSGTDAFASTRRFYEAAAYTQIARIPDFWAKGDDKVVFWKAISYSPMA